MKIKNWIGTGIILAVFCSTVPQAAFALSDGTGVGNGGNSARDEYLAKLKRELRTESTTGADQLTLWCSRVSSILIREKQRAMLQYQYGRKAQAEQILNDALVSAAQSLPADPTIGGPMTKKLIDRALMQSRALDDVLPDNSGLSIATKLNFLFGEVDFIVDVSRNLDPTYYIPYRYRYGGCWDRCSPDFDFPSFEAAFARVAARQLSFATGQLTETVPTNDGMRVYPIGSPEAFLKVAELTTKFVADDLRQNLRAYVYSCAIQDLESLSEELSAYNLYGDRTVFPNDPWAVGQSASTMNRIANQVYGRTGCGR